MFDWIIGVVRQIGVLGVGLLMLAENVFPPLPSELIMPLAGFAAARHELPFWGAVAAGTAGSLAGAVGWYLVGRHVGERRLRAWIDRHGRWLTLSCDDVDSAERWFRRHGGLAVFAGRLVPGVRTFISVPAGFAAMPAGPFVFYSALGTGLWTAGLAFAGRLLGAQYARVAGVLEPVTWAIVGAVLVVYVARLLRWRAGA